MNIYSILSLLATLFTFGLGLFVYFRSQRNRLTLVFFLFTIALALLSLSQFQMRQADAFQEAWLWSKMFSIWPIVLVMSVHFVLELNQNKNRSLLFYSLLYIPGLVLSYVQFATDYIALAPLETYWGWSISYHYGIWHTLSLIFGITYWLISITVPIFYYKTFTGNAKKQALLIVIGYSITFVITFLSDVVFPMFKINIPELGNTANIIPVALIGYAIWRYDMFVINKDSLSDKLFTSISNYLLLIDEDKKILEINQSLLRQLHYSREELIGQRIDFLFEQDPENTNPISQYISQSSEFRNKKIIFINKERQHIPLTFSAFFINQIGHSKQGLIYVGVENTLNIYSQELIDDNNRQIEFLAEAALDLVNLKTKEEVYDYIAYKIYKYVNEQAVIGCTELFGNYEKNNWQVKALYGIDQKLQSLSSVLGFDVKHFSAPTNETFMNQLEVGKLKKLDFNLGDLTDGLLSNKTGEKAKALFGLKELYAIPIQFGNQFFGAIHIATKKTTPPLNKELIESLMSIASIVLNRQYAETELAKSEKLFKTIVENSLISIFIIDLEGKIILAEGKSLQKLRYKSEKIAGKSVFELYSEYPEILRNIKRALKGESFRDLISMIDQLYFNVSFSPFLSEDGQLLGTIAMADEITDRIRSEKKLENLSEMQSKLFQVIGHDLKSPTANILSFSELLLSDFDSFNSQEIRKFVSNIQSSAHNSFSILNGLLEWAKSLQSGICVNTENTCLREASVKAIEQVVSYANKKNIRISNEIKENCFVLADKKMMITVLRNLLSNSVKFTEAGGHIMLDAQKSDKWVNLTISDTGVGMSREQVKTLFLFDTKVVSRGTAGEIGSGLGLQICKDFIEKNHGQISVQSKIKEGSVFTISLPFPSENKQNEIQFPSN